MRIFHAGKAPAQHIRRPLAVILKNEKYAKIQRRLIFL